jgi:hypothetical protein
MAWETWKDFNGKPLTNSSFDLIIPSTVDFGFVPTGLQFFMVKGSCVRTIGAVHVVPGQVPGGQGGSRGHSDLISH